MASYAGAKAAIRSRLEANWSATIITHQNKLPRDGAGNRLPWPPVDASGILKPWVNLEIIGLGSSIYAQGTPGNHLWHYLGHINAHVFVPVDSGDELADQYADQIGDIFRGAKFYDAVTPGCYVRSWAPYPSGGGAEDDDGNWFEVTMTCPFEYWHRG